MYFSEFVDMLHEELARARPDGRAEASIAIMELGPNRPCCLHESTQELKLHSFEQQHRAGPSSIKGQLEEDPVGNPSR